MTLQPNAHSAPRTRIKFCGITRVDDAHEAALLGVDALGVVLAARSPRRVDLAQARRIRAAVPPFVSFVVLFMDESSAIVAEAIAALRPDVLQFHGAEAAAHCAQFGVPYLKAIAMAGANDLARTMAAHPAAIGFVLDGHATGERGGSGKTFDWTHARGIERRVVLAGGLDADNVGAAIRIARPWAVDVSSGIESAPGIKDMQKMQRFVAAVRNVDGE